MVVHGSAAPRSGNMLEKLEIVPEFREGLRVTDDATMNVVEMVLVGSVNKEYRQPKINRAGARAVGPVSKDGMLLHARREEEGDGRHPRAPAAGNHRSRQCGPV